MQNCLQKKCIGCNMFSKLKQKGDKKMKKTLILVLAVIMAVGCVFAFTACNNQKNDYKVGVQSGTTGQYFVEGDADWGFDGFSNIDCKGYNNGGLAVQDMLAGQIDFVVIDEAPAKKLAQTIKGIKVIDIKLTDEEYAFGVDKNQPELLAAANLALSTMKANGTFDAIINKYFGGEGEITGITSATYDANKAQLVVATNAQFAPFEYKIGDKFAGVDMEIAKVIADTLGMELVIMDMDFEAVVTSVGKNGVDIAMAGLTVNETRKQSVNFSDSYYNAAQMIIVKADDTTFDSCTTADDVIKVMKKA